VASTGGPPAAVAAGTGPPPTRAAEPAPAAAATPAAATVGAPLRVRADAAGLDAAVVAVGVTGDGQMEVPERVADVGWYRFGPLPGAATGSAVLAGHVDDRLQGDGAFAELGRLAPGDEVVVDRPEGSVAYVVREVRSYSKETLPVADLFREDGQPRLALVTCDGPFDTDARAYRDNLVVLADPR
jgi:LPXTG-site transpeptidase (sortase) family protein